MGGDMMTALGRAAVDGRTIFGHNACSRANVPFHLERALGGTHAPEESVRATFIDLPQARRTCPVLGGRVGNSWGYVQGVNGHGVAAGCTRLRTRLHLDGPGLTGPDLVRLALERGPSARQAMEVATGLIARHGQGSVSESDDNSDAAILIADAHEAFLVEASGTGWVCQEIGEVRAASDICTIRQDWDAIAPGLAGRVIEHNWWPEDGSKLDFAGALAAGRDTASALRRWGRATRLLEEQSGAIDVSFLRRVLSDHYDGTDDEVDPLDPAGPRPLCSHAGDSQPFSTVSSLIADLRSSVPVAWWAYGPPCASVYLPLLPAGHLPSGLVLDADERIVHLAAAAADPERRGRVRSALEGLQALFDAETAEFLSEAATSLDAERQATLFMQHVWEEFAEVADALLGHCPLPVSDDPLPVF